MTEIRATDLPTGTTADVEVLADGTFFVRVYLFRRTGESRGAETLSEGIREAIAAAEGRPVPEDSMRHPGAAANYADMIADAHRAGDLP
jgi:hypothetical protein